MAEGSVLAEAYVRLRALADGSFEKDARDQVMPAAGRIATDLAGVFASKKLFDIGKSGFDELKDAQTVSSQTTVLLRNLGSTAGVTSDEVDNLAQSMLDQSGVDDEVAKGAENVLLRLGLQGDAFKQATQTSNDLSVAMGTDMTSAAQTLAIAMEHPEQAARRLKPVIGGLTDEQTNSIKAFMAQGDAAAASQVVLDAVTDKVKGAAKEYGDTLPGGLSKATESWKNAKAELVGGFAPAVELGADLTTKFAGVIQDLPGPAADALGAVVLLGGGIATMARPVNDVLNLFAKWRDAHAAAKIAVEEETVANTALATSEDAVAASTGAASTGVGAILGPVGLAIGAVAALETVITLFSSSEESAAVKAADYTQALKEQGAAADEDADKVTAYALAQDKAAQKAHDAGLSYKDMFDAVRQGGVDFGELERQIGDAGNTLEEALKNGGAESSEFGRQLLFLAEHGKLTREAALDLLKTLEGLHNKYDDTKRSTDAESEALGLGAKALGKNTAGVDDNADALDRAKKALQNYQDVLRGNIDPLQAMLKAVQDQSRAQNGVTDAQNDLNDAIKKHGKNSTEAADAQRKLEDAQNSSVSSTLDLQSASAELEAKIRAQPGLLASAKNQLNEWVAQGLITRDTADQIAARFDYVAATAANLQGKNIAMTLSLDDPGVVSRLHEIGQLVQTLTDGSKTIEVDIAARNVPQRARGGPIGAGQVFEGGELGPELLLLNRHALYQSPGDGTVITADQTRGLLGGGGSAGSQPSVVFDPRIVVEIDGYAIATAMRNYDRSLR